MKQLIGKRVKMTQAGVEHGLLRGNAGKNKAKTGECVGASRDGKIIYVVLDGHTSRRQYAAEFFEEDKNMSELAKHRALIEPYVKGCGLDVGSQGHAVFPHAWQLDLPSGEFEHYNGGHPPAGPIQLRGHADSLPVDDNSLDFLIASHLLEDYGNWDPILREWVRVLKPGGYLIILVPDKTRFRAVVAAGQPDNPNHVHESYAGELSLWAERLNLKVIMDKLASLDDYTILFCASKL